MKTYELKVQMPKRDPASRITESFEEYIKNAIEGYHIELGCIMFIEDPVVVSVTEKP